MALVGESKLRGVLEGVLLLDVELELVASVELLVAVQTFKQFDVEVPSLVVLHIAVRDEPLAAKFTSKRLLFRVGPDVVHQACLVLQYLLALSVRALVGLWMLGLVV